MFTDQHIATFIFASPFLALCAGGLIGQYFAIREQIEELRKRRADAPAHKPAHADVPFL